ncbi:MAG: aminotransferase class IV [Acidimicrobiales bacterium]
MSNQGGIVWLGGELVRLEEARVPVTDHGLTVGDGLFETFKVINGVAFALGRHLRRLAHSAAGLGLAVPSDATLRRAVSATVGANPGCGRVRLTVTAGPGPAGTARGASNATVLVVCSPPAAWPPSEHVATVPWTRNERGALAGLKTTSYAENVVALGDARQRGAGEAIFANTNGDLCEGTGTNVFVVLDSVLITPPLASGCLAGITRGLVCELVEVEERTLPLGALATASEAFLTSSTRDVHPIATVDGVALASCPGTRTIEGAEAYAACVERNLDP